MKMILKYFLSDKDFSMSELEQFSGKLPGMSTWPQQMVLSLSKMGFDVFMVEGFDGQAFIKEGTEYLRRAFGEEAAAWQVANSDIAQEQRTYRALLNDPSIRVENRIPDLNELKPLLQKGYLLNVVVNSRKLNGQDGYLGHSVVVYEITDSEFIFHDPGLPAGPARKVTYEAFEKAWADPNSTAKNYIAIKLKEPVHV